MKKQKLDWNFWPERLKIRLLNQVLIVEQQTVVKKWQLATHRTRTVNDLRHPTLNTPKNTLFDKPWNKK